MQDTYANITGIHDKWCIKKVVACTNATCTRTMKRLSLKRHFEECEYAKVPCKCIKLGCHVKLQRVDMEIHEKEDKCHLHLSLDTVAKFEDEKTKMRAKISKLEGKLQKTTFKFTGYAEKRDRGEGICQSPDLQSRWV